MNKAIFLVLILIFGNNNCEAQNKWSLYHLNGKVKELLITNITLGGKNIIQFNNKGNYVSYQNWNLNQELVSREIYTRDNKGNLIFLTYLNGDTSKYIYFKNGQVKSCSLYSSNTALRSKVDYNYQFNETGKIIEETYTSIDYEKNEIEIVTTKYLYSTKGNLIKENEERQVGGIKYFRTEEYDTLGRTVKIENSSTIKEDKPKQENYLYSGNDKLPIKNTSFIDGRLWSEVIYTNDSNGNPVKTINKNYVDETTVDTEYNEYQYDVQGNWIKKTSTTVYQDNRFKSYPVIVERTITYY